MDFNDFYEKPGKRRQYKHSNNKNNNNKNNKKHNGNNYLIEVYNDTKSFFSEMKPQDIQESIKYDIENIIIVVDDNINTYVPEIIVLNQDTLDMAIDFVNLGLHPLVINMASDIKPGGGVRSGKTAQEEVIFRRTNAFLTHYEHWYKNRLAWNEVIYSPEVMIIKDLLYKYLKESDQRTISMIAVPALRNPKLINNKYNSDQRETMSLKIEAIFKIAILNKKDSLVLGALGCGAFNNPPEEVAQIFKQMITKYGKYFKKIGFAVLVVKDSDKLNFDAFKILMNRDV